MSRTALALRNAEAIIAGRRSQPVSTAVEAQKMGF